MLDTHCHLDFLPGAARGALLGMLEDAGILPVAQTVTPAGFGALRGPTPPAGFAVSLGLHPWFIAANDAGVEEQLGDFSRLLPAARFIGEIGLDFAPRRLKAVPARYQERVLREIFTLLAASPGSHRRVMSIHTVRSAARVLDLIEETACPAVPVFHRFNGTSDELTRLIRAGGYISVHPLMLRSKRGRAYVTQVPCERLLLESDLPSQPLHHNGADTAVQADGTSGAEVGAQIVDALRTTVAQLSRLRGIPQESLISYLRATEHELYGELASQARNEP